MAYAMNAMVDNASVTAHFQLIFGRSVVRERMILPKLLRRETRSVWQMRLQPCCDSAGMLITTRAPSVWSAATCRHFQTQQPEDLHSGSGWTEVSASRGCMLLLFRAPP